MGQRRLHIFNTVHDGAFHGANGPAFHLAQRRPHQPVRHLKAQALQDRVGGYMGQHGGQGISRHLDGIAGQTHAAPKYNALPVRLTLQKEPDDLVNAEIRYEAPSHTENSHYHRPGHLPPAGCGEGEQDTEPSFVPSCAILLSKKNRCSLLALTATIIRNSSSSVRSVLPVWSRLDGKIYWLSAGTPGASCPWLP